ncbi:uncharacterized protein TRIVIDRAFT_151885 [Trichoderma virens Gv29-8]|uniref:Aminotransferase class I/classII large domain-containing protein n=2 Tax=Hypocrea virens TaxID=29875 RepID=G9MUZ8_HYPVG|nr:uncharacterized protein TRIVIDRAFT_151885 [Trichoderma virens Gv29-8]ABV48722.1 aminotransferase [Trichoderma virens]EHK21722.1 hypothetical protein TRIVIDRAFT_151885 [Trichoderma virens Gv29-8]UKZ55818.1 putative secondary metabolism biosynthetic enzyme [Trichoderma virens]
MVRCWLVMWLLLTLDLAYATGIGGSSQVRSLMAKLLNSHFRPAQSVDASHIVLAAGGSFALTALVEQICNPGDGILIATPYWSGLDISISIHAHGKILPVYVPLDKFFLPESVEHYEEALLSKDFGCNGIRVAVRLSAALSTHSQVSSLSMAFTSRAILRSSFVEEIAYTRNRTLSQAYSVVSSFLNTNQMEFIPAYYGMFVFARLRNLDTDFEAEKRLLACLKTRGVSLSTGSSYHFNEAGWFRICYAVPISQLHEGLKRIAFGVRDYLGEMEPGLSV